MAIENLPSLPHINVVGSMITATHGSGHLHSILADRIISMDIIFPDGTLQTFTKNRTPHFKHYLINLGGLGIITSMTIKLVDKFMVNKSIYLDLPWDTLFQKENLDQIMHRQEYLSFFTKWKSRKMDSVWIGKRYMPDQDPPEFEGEFFGAKHLNNAAKRIHPNQDRDPTPCVTYGNGLWSQKIYHFLPD